MRASRGNLLPTGDLLTVFWLTGMTCRQQQNQSLFEATTILDDEVHASVEAEKMKIVQFWSKKKFLSSVPSLNLLKSHSKHCPDSGGNVFKNHELRDNEINTASGEARSTSAW